MSGSLTLGRWLDDRARNTPDRVAIEFLGQATTYRALDAASRRIAAGLTEVGLQRGDRLATLTATSPDHVAVLFACARLGLTLLPLSWRLSAAELAYQLDDAEPALLLVSSEHVALAEATGTPVPRQRLGEVGDMGIRAEDELTDVAEDDDPLLLVYTSGTTGRPKGALLTHANCFWTNLSLDRTTGVRDDDVVLQVLPQFHVGGWNVQPLLAWWKGATVVLEPSFDPGRTLRLIEDLRVTTMMGVPATYLFLAQHERFADTDLSSLRSVVVGGAPMPEPLLEAWLARGVAIIQGYGLTEAAPNVLCLPPDQAASRLGWAGVPYPHVDVALRDPESGAHLAGAATGELVVRGPNVFAGYWRNPGATKAAFADGWLLTGDVAERDAGGMYRIVDRLKDMVISGGENVYPAEIESVLHAHPAVLEAAVVGVPDERWGEVCIAFVALRDGAAASEDELLTHCRGSLARFKVPKSIRVVGALPRSAMGKILRDDLRGAVVR